VGAFITALPPLAITLANAYFALTDQREVLGIYLLKVHALNAILLLGIIVHFLYAWLPCCGRRDRWRREDDSEPLMRGARFTPTVRPYRKRKGR
jgi:hypothetical protein